MPTASGADVICILQLRKKTYRYHDTVCTALRTLKYRRGGALAYVHLNAAPPDPTCMPHSRQCALN